MPTRATAASWKHQPFRDGVPLPYRARFDAAELERLRAGLVPEEMEDRWFVFHDAPHLHFRRSWSGDPIYRVTLAPDGEGAEATNALWATEVASPDEADRGREAESLAGLIARLLLS